MQRFTRICIVFLLVVAGCSSGGGENSGGSGGTAPVVVGMQPVDGNGQPRGGFPRGSLVRLEFVIDDPEMDASGGWLSFYPGNEVTPFYGPEPIRLELISAAAALYLSSPIALPVDLPTGRYRLEAEIVDDTNLASRPVFVWIDVV